MNIKTGISRLFALCIFASQIVLGGCANPISSPVSIPTENLTESAPHAATAPLPLFVMPQLPGVIFFSSWNGQFKGVYAFEAWGAQPEELQLPPDLQVFRLAASPDSSSLAFIGGTSGKGEQPKVYLLDAQGNLVILSQGGVYSDIAWSPDGSQLATFGSAALAAKPNSAQANSFIVMSPNGNNQGPLFESLSGNSFLANAPVVSLRWSQDGKSVAVLSSEVDKAKITIVNVATGEILRTLVIPNKTLWFDWSHDNTRFCIAREDSQTHQDNVYVLNADGTPGLNGDLFSLVSVRQTGDSAWCAWSPDDQYLAYAAAQGDHLGGPTFFYITNGIYRIRVQETLDSVVGFAWSPETVQ